MGYSKSPFKKIAKNTGADCKSLGKGTWKGCGGSTHQLEKDLGLTRSHN